MIDNYTTFQQLKKDVANSILKSGIANEPDRCRYIHMDSRYVAPKLVALMLTNYNLRGVVTCKANRKGFASDLLKMDNTCERKLS